jgi:ABC-2 type transport system permease protein
MRDFFLFRNALRDLLSPRRLLSVGLLVLLPVGVALLVRSLPAAHKFEGAEAYDRLTESLIFGVLLVLLACVLGTGVVSREMEERTLGYLLTRPIARWRILLAKFAAAFCATTLAAWVATLLLLAATRGLSDWSGSPVGRDLLILPVASLAYGGFFLLLATLFRRPLIFGLLYTFGIETWLPNLPGRFKLLSLMAYLRVLAPHAKATSDASPMNPFLATIDLSSSLSWWVVASVIGVALLGAMAVFSVREYVPQDEV